MSANHRLQEPDPLDAAADQMIAVCDGNLRGAVCALIAANGLLEAELNDVYATITKGYARGRIKRREQDEEEAMADGFLLITAPKSAFEWMVA
jgi:hypothetical protein